MAVKRNPLTRTPWSCALLALSCALDAALAGAPDREARREVEAIARRFELLLLHRASVRFSRENAK